MRTQKREPLESTEQAAFVARVKSYYPDVVIFAIPNGGARRAKEAARMKGEGVLAGVCDLFVCEARGGFFGLFIEMKRTSSGRLSEEQRNFILNVETRGYCTAICHGREEAMAAFSEYMRLPKT